MKPVKFIVDLGDETHTFIMGVVNANCTMINARRDGHRARITDASLGQDLAFRLRMRQAEALNNPRNIRFHIADGRPTFGDDVIALAL